MNNHWLSCLKKKQLFKEIDAIGVEVWTEDGTLGDLFAVLNDEQKEFLMNMLIRDFLADSTDMSFGIDLIAP
jgi:hypothetical protein